MREHHDRGCRRRKGAKKQGEELSTKQAKLLSQGEVRLAASFERLAEQLET